jgi:hypothetical protein
MKATYNKNAKTKFTTFHRKENKCYFDSYSAIVIRPDYDGKPSVFTPVELRLYGTGNSNSAAIWINDNNSGIHTSGTGSAGGYGYHRASAAAAEAIKNAGIDLDTNISGVGESAIERAVKAIAEMLGYNDCPVFHAHQ